MESSAGYLKDWLLDTRATTTLLIGLLGSILIFVIVRRTFGKRDKLPPGPMRIPFPLNMIASLFSKTGRMEAILAATERYGDLMTFDMNGNRRIFIGSPELVREIFVTQADISSNRPEAVILKSVVKLTGGIIFGKSWQSLRRFSLSALRSFGMGKRSIEAKIAEEARMFTEELFESQTAEGVNPSNLLNKAVSNVICSFTFGERFEYSDPEFIVQVKNINKMMAGGSVGPAMNILTQRYPRLFSMFANLKKRTAHLRSLKDFIVKQVEEHDRTFNGDDLRDIVDSLLAECRRLEENGMQDRYITKEEIWMPVFDLFVAGTETTSSAMAWFFILMAGHPDVQEKVIKEINAVIGQERAPAYEDRKDMPYTEATLTEVLRYRPVGPFSLLHIASDNIKVRGYVIPKGCGLFVNILGIHHDPKLFPEPSKFDPTRFLSDDGRTFVKNEGFVAFSQGRRSCLGEQLARMEFFLFATSVLQRFFIRLPEGATPDYSIKHSHLSLLPIPFRIHLDKR